MSVKQIFPIKQDLTEVICPNQSLKELLNQLSQACLGLDRDFYELARAWYFYQDRKEQLNEKQFRQRLESFEATQNTAKRTELIEIQNWRRAAYASTALAVVIYADEVETKTNEIEALVPKIEPIIADTKQDFIRRFGIHNCITAKLACSSARENCFDVKDALKEDPTSELGLKALAELLKNNSVPPKEIQDGILDYNNFRLVNEGYHRTHTFHGLFFIEQPKDDHNLLQELTDIFFSTGEILEKLNWGYTLVENGRRDIHEKQYFQRLEQEQVQNTRQTIIKEQRGKRLDYASRTLYAQLVLQEANFIQSQLQKSIKKCKEALDKGNFGEQQQKIVINNILAAVLISQELELSSNRIVNSLRNDLTEGRASNQLEDTFKLNMDEFKETLFVPNNYGLYRDPNHSAYRSHLQRRSR